MPHPRLHPFTPEKLLDLGQRIRNVPVLEYNPWQSERPLTRLEMVALIKDDIASMRDKGYRVLDIAEFLGANGFAISAACLYETMRELGCSLRRDPVPLAKRLRDHLAHEGVAPAGTRTLPQRAPGKSGAPAHGPSTAQEQRPPFLNDDPATRVTILPKAQRRLNKLASSVAIVFKQAVLQLQYGEQRIRLDPETGNAALILAQAGLLNPVHEEGNDLYEVPFDMAHVQVMPRHRTTDETVDRASK